MPSALLRACSGSGCGGRNLVARGLCLDCARAVEQRRGTAASRGYDRYWLAFREKFPKLLLAAGLPRVCGASLPGGPVMTASQCRARGILNAMGLHLHHDPPLRPEERGNHRIVCNPLRVGYLCSSCHSQETQRQMQAGLV